MRNGNGGPHFRCTLSNTKNFMKRILLTGLSGVGKSTVIDKLAAHGYKAIDLDDAAFSQWIEVDDELAKAAGEPVEPGRDWVWRADRVRLVLAMEDADVLFVSGTAANMRQFLSQFDHVVLLSAPPEVIVERLRTRTTNTYGKRPDEVARVLGLIESVEPLLCRAADHEIDTGATLDEVVASVLRLV